MTGCRDQTGGLRLVGSDWPCPAVVRVAIRAAAWMTATEAAFVAGWQCCFAKFPVCYNRRGWHMSWIVTSRQGTSRAARGSKLRTTSAVLARVRA